MISYIGGKARIGKWIVPFIPKDIETYVEAFSGMFWVFFKMDLNSYPNLKTVVYNDFNGLNANLFDCCRDYDRLWDEVSKYPCQQLGIEDTPSEYREMFDEYQKEVFHSGVTITQENKYEIASKYVYVLTQIFSGSKPETSSYIDYKGKYRCKVLIFLDKLKNPEYRKHFDRGDHERLANTLINMKGMFSLSYYDFPLLKEWFSPYDYVWEKKEFAKAAAAKSGKKQNMGEELLIMNYGNTKVSKPVRGEQLDLFIHTFI
jgi:site-specific DNA-adenine methylase